MKGTQKHDNESPQNEGLGPVEAASASDGDFSFGADSKDGDAEGQARADSKDSKSAVPVCNDSFSSLPATVCNPLATVPTNSAASASYQSAKTAAESLLAPKASNSN